MSLGAWMDDCQPNSEVGLRGTHPLLLLFSAPCGVSHFTKHLHGKRVAVGLELFL